MKTDRALWSEMRKVLAEMNRVGPTLEGRPGRLGWLKRAVLQLVRPLAVPQVDFNKHLMPLLDRVVSEMEAASERLDALEESVRGFDVAMEKLTTEVRDLARGRGVGVATQPPRAAPSFPSARPPALQEALERGFYLQNVNPGRFNILDEIGNWDVLVVLDACRHDAFERVWRPAMRDRLPGELHKRVSVGSHTVTWLKETFRGRDADAARIVYLAANPHVSKGYLERLGITAAFAHVEELWNTRWDSRERTVMPEHVIEEYLRLRERFGGKKFLLHFLQPHTPYVGKTRLRTEQPPEMPSAVNAQGEPHRVPTELALIEDCQASLAQGLQAYDDNLRRALDAIVEMLPKKAGRVAITADHGELFGEYGVYGHVEEMSVPELIEVPWFVCA